MVKVAFFVRHFTERGTEVAIYDYAHYNETILKNKSIIICFTESAQQRIRFPSERISYPKFRDRFPIFEIDTMNDMTELISREQIDIFYTLTAGDYEPMYKFSDPGIWKGCKTVKHCVFTTQGCESDRYVGISEYLNHKFHTTYPVIPHMISLPPCEDTLRQTLGIPTDAIVLGRHGGYTTFDMKMTHNAIQRFVNTSPGRVYFLLMNTAKFYNHPRILHIDATTDFHAKSMFINSCDAMIHGRVDGEIFPISIGEFSIFNKPVITTPRGDLGHIFNLKDRAIIYNSEDELVSILTNINHHIHTRTDWNAYEQYTPDNVMNIFRQVVCDA
jgi:hypothetical protein